MNISPLSLISACWPAHLSSFPSSHSPSWAGPVGRYCCPRDSPAPRRPKSRAPLLQPPRLPFLLQPLTPGPARQCRPLPPATAARVSRNRRPRPRRASWDRPPRAPAATNRSRAPPRAPLLPPLQFSPSLALRRPPPSLGEAPPSTEFGTAVDHLPRAISDPFLPRGETPMLSSLSLSFTLAFDGLNGRFACGREALGRRPWRPPLQLSPPATFSA